ncbi:MAG: Glu/Leu/Phe/Val dehydrogenase dimerization domain-containing protein [Candidatus Izemoplasmatales bacterium]|jgi:leucine dehydrogenase|nr:Glu/Leu/Phe/Val dehydrogenase dimerization domain-containing protein [Candidatus Izemoplasmatales bacterium]MDD3864699.1 Glu/Leu/Phe/Val dehydrogenase dimerization domain-containing protein [Candidatus Izemoplasmatales bacterium]
MNKFDYMEKYGYEQLIYFYDKTTGLKGITCIHDTTLGPALGGTRLWNYASEDDAVLDCLRLARGMTFKAAAAGLNLGGGKTVLIGDASKVKCEAYFRALGRYVQSLNGRYITAEDVNTNTKDMDYVYMETDHVVGLEGKSGNPSPITAVGVFHGIRASLKYAFGNDDISQYTFAVQGAGETGYYLIKKLIEAKAKKIYFSEINPSHIERMNTEHPEVEIVEPDKIYDMDVDVFSPCAFGAILNDVSIPRIKAKIIAGSANNVLFDEEKHGPMIKEKGILYAPDFVINAGGLINVYHEIIGYNAEKAMRDTEKIYDRLLEIYAISDKENTDTNTAANIYAKNRMRTINHLHANYIPY